MDANWLDRDLSDVRVRPTFLTDSDAWMWEQMHGICRLCGRHVSDGIYLSDGGMIHKPCLERVITEEARCVRDLYILRSHDRQSRPGAHLSHPCIVLRHFRGESAAQYKASDRRGPRGAEAIRHAIRSVRSPCLVWWARTIARPCQWPHLRPVQSRWRPMPVRRGVARYTT